MEADEATRQAAALAGIAHAPLLQEPIEEACTGARDRIDAMVEFLEPIALTRPAFDLRCGAGTLLERHRRLGQHDAGRVGLSDR